MARAVDYKPKPIDQDFLKKPEEFPVTGEHAGHKVRAEGKERLDNEGKPNPTHLGIHGTAVGVDWEACVADGACMDVCPVNVFEWLLAPGKSGTGNDKPVAQGSDEYNKYRTDKCDPIREADCIFCHACETACPTAAVKITEAS